MNVLDHLDEPVPSAIQFVQVGCFRIQIPRSEVGVIRDVFEQQEYAVPPEYLRADGVVLDLGAHVGTFALYAKAYWSPRAIHCFEPAPQTIELLRQNVGAFPEIRVYPSAIGSSNKQTDMYLNSVNSMANTLHPQLTHEANRQQRICVPVVAASRSWDSLNLEEVDVLKIDVEGSEIDVLTSLGDRLDRCRVVMVEYHDSEYRREIDRLLPRHLLFGARIMDLSRGTVKYVRENLFTRVR